MAGIPAAFAGDRNLLGNPDAAGTATALGDLAALNLQTLHLMQARLVADGAAQAEVDRVAEGLRNALAAANAFRSRESSTRELRPMSRIPRDFGATNNLAQVRMNQLSQFDGESKDSREIVRWLNRMVTASASHDLTEDATLNLLIHCSKGAASDLIDRLRNEGKHYPEVARCLELRYGELCSSDEAMVKANTLARYHNEPLATFLDRLRHVCEMAKRGIEEQAPRQAAIDALVESNIRRVLPTSVREALEERILARTRMGQPPFTLMELEKECIELERKRDERHSKKKVKHSSGHHRGIRAVQQHQVQHGSIYRSTTTSGYDSTYDGSSSGEEASPDEEEAFSAPDQDDTGLVALVNHFDHYRDKYQSRKGYNKPQQAYQKAIYRYNKYPQQDQGSGPQSRGQQRRGQGYRGQGPARYHDKPQARQITAQGYPQPNPDLRQPGQQAVQGPPNRLDPRRSSIREMLAYANCVTGECIRCGRAGHVMNSDACPLRGKPLQDRACMKCNKGLHGVDDCLAAFQQPQQGQVNQITADWSDDSEDLNE